MTTKTIKGVTPNVRSVAPSIYVIVLDILISQLNRSMSITEEGDGRYIDKKR